MAFSIAFLSEPVPSLEVNEPACPGLIELGSFQERFVSSLSYWNVNDYKRHWRQAITRIVESSQKSCLITSMYDPSTANFIFWYPMYRVDDTVFVQNQILFLNQLSAPFDERDPFSFVSERKSVNDEGESLSEWCVQVEELESFLTQNVSCGSLNKLRQDRKSGT